LTNDRRVPAAELRQFVANAFQAAGYDASQAALATDVLLWASLRGVDTHGVRNLKSYYIDRTLEGLLRPAAQITVEHETTLAARLDGGSGLGLCAARHAMELAIAKARRQGVGIVAVRNSHHLGPAGYFAHIAVEQGMLGACATGHFFGAGHPIGMAPPGSALALFSTNPLSFAAPCGARAPLVVDMATAAATVNRIEMYGQQGRAIPFGWAADAAGRPTTDPAAARLLRPLGGEPELGAYKGVALSLLVTTLACVLSGAWATLETGAAAEEASSGADPAPRYEQPTMGHFLAALDIETLQARATFESAMEAMVDALRQAPTLAGQPALTYPGEVEQQTAETRSREGIPLSAYVRQEFRELAVRLALPRPTWLD
jgi:LDH2 family malate/lactate/ureidoglycolate dehydrogenase